MIKTICFDLGGDKELFLTIDEIIKLQAAFRFVSLDKYGPPGTIHEYTGAKPPSIFGAVANSGALADYQKELEGQLRNRHQTKNQQIDPPKISNPFPHPSLGDIKY